MGLLAGKVVTVALFLLLLPTTGKVEQLSYTQLKSDIRAGQVAKLLRQAEQRATSMLTDHRDALDNLTDLLLERETVDGTDVDEALGRIPGQRQPIGATGHSASAAMPAGGSASAGGR